MLVAVALAVAAYTVSRKPAAVGDRSIAVLPFENVGGDSTQEYFSEGVTDELNSALAQVPGIRVAARSSAYTFKGKRVDAREVGRVLGVGNVLEGRIRRDGAKLRLTAELVNATDGMSLWNAAFDRDAKDVFAVQEELARAIVGALSVKLDAGAIRKTARATDPVTYDLYLRGKYRLNSAVSEHDYDAAKQVFQQVIARDSLYAPAYAAIANADMQVMDAFRSPRDIVPLALAAAQRAVALDANLADGHAMLAAMNFFYLWNVPAARVAGNQALALNPNDAVSLLYSASFGGMSLIDTTRLRVVVPLVRRLDPLNPFFNAWSVLFWRILNEPDSAIAQYGHVQEVSPGYVYLEPWVDDVYRARKQYPEALRVGMEASKARGRPTSGLIVTLAAMGRRDEAMRQTKALEAYVSQGHFVPPEILARAWMAIGDRERAIRYLENGVEARSGFALQAMTWFPELQPLSDDPRVRQIHAKFVLH